MPRILIQRFDEERTNELVVTPHNAQSMVYLGGVALCLRACSSSAFFAVFGASAFCEICERSGQVEIGHAEGLQRWNRRW